MTVYHRARFTVKYVGKMHYTVFLSWHFIIHISIFKALRSPAVKKQTFKPVVPKSITTNTFLYIYTKYICIYIIY